MRVRIAIIGSTPPSKGGIETFLAAYIEGLAERGHEVLVISDGETPSVERRGSVAFHRLSLSSPMLSNSLDQMEETSAEIQGLIRDFAPDVLHIHPSGFEVLIARISLRPFKKLPIVLTLHGVTYAKHKVSQFHRISIVTAVSESVAEACAGFAPEIRVVENALPLLSVPSGFPEQPRVGALGRLVTEKGFDTLIEAMAIVRHEIPSAKLVLAGLGPEATALRNMALEKLTSEDAFEMPGWVSAEARSDFFFGSQVVVVPSRWEEGFGLVAIEAAQYARPVVVTNRGELPYLVIEGETGHIVPVDDPDTMAQAILGLLSDPLAAERMGNAAQAFVRKRFDFNRMMDRYESVLRDAIEMQG